MQNKNNKKCSIHPDLELMGVCIKSKCQYQNRFICFLCTIQDHKEHIDYFLPIADILKPSVKINWPQDDIGRKISQLLIKLKEIENVNDIDKIFDQFTQQQTKTIQQLKIEAQQSFLKSQEYRKKFIQKLEESYKHIYDIEPIKNYLQEYLTLAINEQQFNNKMEKYLQNDNDEKKNQQMALSDIVSNEQQLKEFIIFDRSKFNEFNQQCQQQIKNFGMLFKTVNCKFVYEFNFITAPVKNSSSLEYVQDGIRFKMNGQCVAISNISLKNGIYDFKLKMENYTSGCIVFGIEKEESINHSSYWGSNPAVCITCNKQDAIQFNLIQGQNYLGYYKGQGKIYKVQIQIEKNIFKVMDEEQISVMSCSVVLKDMKWRFFINNYSGQPCEFSLIDAQYKQ